jgi:hypothetical protein
MRTTSIEAENTVHAGYRVEAVLHWSNSSVSIRVQHLRTKTLYVAKLCALPPPPPPGIRVVSSREEDMKEKNASKEADEKARQTGQDMQDRMRFMYKAIRGVPGTPQPVSTLKDRRGRPIELDEDRSVIEPDLIFCNSALRPYLRGETLKERLDQGLRIERADIPLLLPNLLATLQAAHERGIFRHDLTPQHILLLQNPWPGQPRTCVRGGGFQRFETFSF